jgi:hypothetical protein
MKKQIPSSFDTIVIDGDWLAYYASFVTQSKRVFIKDKNGVHITDKPSLTSCKAELEKLSIEITDCLVSTEVTVHKNWELIARKIINKKVEELKTRLNANNVIIVFGRGN